MATVVVRYSRLILAKPTTAQPVAGRAGATRSAVLAHVKFPRLIYYRPCKELIHTIQIGASLSRLSTCVKIDAPPPENYIKNDLFKLYKTTLGKVVQGCKATLGVAVSVCIHDMRIIELRSYQRHANPVHNTNVVPCPSCHGPWRSK